MNYTDEWVPMFEEDFNLQFNVNPIGYMRHMVFNRNESWDSRILGFRGGGKSTIGLSLSLMFNPKLLDMSPHKALNRCWCFTTEQRNEKKELLKRGDVLCMDEQGTRKGASSYKFMTPENQEFADMRQIDRVDGVIELGITLDEMRIMKRIRNIYRVDIFPETKLTDNENKGLGMGIDCIFREIVENPFATHDVEKLKPKYFKYADGGRIARITVPLPPMDYWNEYMKRRREFKETLALEEIQERNKSSEEYNEDFENTKRHYHNRIEALRKKHEL